MKEPRKVRCALCPRMEPLAYDDPGVAVQLPKGWRALGKRKDGTTIFMCPSCLEMERER